MMVSTTPISIWPTCTATMGRARRTMALSSSRKVIGIAELTGQTAARATTSRGGVPDFPRTSDVKLASNLSSSMRVRLMTLPRAAAMSRAIVFLVVLGAVAGPLAAQNIHPTTPPVARAVPLQGEIKIDGKLDDPIWQ